MFMILMAGFFQASKDKQYLRQGMCDVQKALRRNETGVVVLAGR